MKIIYPRWISEAFLIVFAIILVFFTYKIYIFQCTPREAERMLGYFHFAKKVILQYGSFPHFTWNFTQYRYTYEQFITYEYFSMPETPLLTPFIFIYFLPNIVASEKISLALHIIIGVLGIFALGKHFKLNKTGTLLWVSIWFLSDNLISQYNSGHINWKTIYLFP